MLMRTDPFRDLDRLTQSMSGTASRPALAAMDAWRDHDTFVVEFDLPGVEPGSIDLEVERTVLSVGVERLARQGTAEVLAAERPRGLFKRQLILGDDLDTASLTASYAAGVLRLEIPVAERAKPQKIAVEVAEGRADVAPAGEPGTREQATSEQATSTDTDDKEPVNV